MSSDRTDKITESQVVTETTTDADPVGAIKRPAASRFGRRAMTLAGYAAGISAVMAAAETPTQGNFNPFS